MQRRQEHGISLIVTLGAFGSPRAAISISDPLLVEIAKNHIDDLRAQEIATVPLQLVDADPWCPVETMKLYDVGVVTDGERAAISQKAESDFGDTYFAVDPEDGLDWEPTHWLPLPK